ncbi:MAG: flagellar hook-basal body complex protein FliE [Gammaproteobacteria bacterium]
MNNTIDTTQLLAQMRAMAAQAQSKPSVAEANSAANPDFSSLFKSAIEKVNDVQQQAGNLAQAFEAGDSKVELTEVMVGLQKASLSFQAMTQVRNKLVSAYQEVMSMPI